jgi:hypothetical protein
MIDGTARAQLFASLNAAIGFIVTIVRPPIEALLEP